MKVCKMYRGDRGRKLQIEGLTVPDGDIEVHFSLDEYEGTIEPQIGHAEGNIITVDIPNSIFKTEDAYGNTYNAYAFIYLTDEESGYTKAKIAFTIKNRPDPENISIPEPEQAGFLEEVRKIMNSTKEIAQSVRNDADEGRFDFTYEDFTDEQKQTLEDKVADNVKETVQRLVAVYGETTYEEVLKAYKEGRDVVLVQQGDYQRGDRNNHARLVRVDGSGDNRVFMFVNFLARVESYYEINYDSKKWMSHSDNLNQFFNNVNAELNKKAYTTDVKKMLENKADKDDLVFYATYGETTCEELLQAAEAGRQILLRRYTGEGGTFNEMYCAYFIPDYEKRTLEAKWTAPLDTGCYSQWTFNSAKVDDENTDNGWSVHWENKLIDETKLPFIAEYGVTTHEELVNSYKSGKLLVLNIPKEKRVAQLAFVDKEGDEVIGFTFALFLNQQEKQYTISKSGTWSYAYCDIPQKGEAWSRIAKAESRAEDAIKDINNLKKIAFDKFRGGFRDNGGTITIRPNNLYLFMQGGTNNKNIKVMNGETVELDATYNGIAILCYENGAGTVVGIKTALIMADAFKFGTYQLYTENGVHKTTVTYPDMCVVAVLGNGTTDITS